MLQLLLLYCLVVDITEIGRMTRTYCELAQRNEPTLSDVQIALMECGEYWAYTAMVIISRAIY